MKYLYLHTLLLLITILLSACTKQPEATLFPSTLQDLSTWRHEAYQLHSSEIRSHLRQLLETCRSSLRADIYTKQYYTHHGKFLWITRYGATSQVDSLLTWLKRAPVWGLHTEDFFVSHIEDALQEARKPDSLQSTSLNATMAQLEMRCTQAYLRIASGHRYGFTRPSLALNHLLKYDEAKENSPFRRLYDIPTETPNDSFLLQAIHHAQSKSVAPFLRSVYPADSLYRIFSEAYLQCSPNDSIRKKRLRINMERSRWRMKRPQGKHVWVNLASMELTARNPQNDSNLTMRICGGNQSHKTPLLHSQISHIELNPYWVIPQSIIKREIAPLHAGTSEYFDRNKIRIIDKETQEEVDPESLTAAELSSGLFTLRQDKGEGNSLGRIIFRFPNSFAVFLHDTNNRSAFKRSNRAISHGCIRLERPLDLALFLMESPNPKTIDRIRLAIDLPPLTSYGRDLQVNPEYKHLHVYHFTPKIPLFIEYYTAYPDSLGLIKFYPDTYHYDTVIEKMLDAY